MEMIISKEETIFSLKHQDEDHSLGSKIDCLKLDFFSFHPFMVDQNK